MEVSEVGATDTGASFYCDVPLSTLQYSAVLAHCVHWKKKFIYVSIVM